MSLGSLAALISIVGHVPYIRGIVRGKVRPERSSWAIWSFILFIAFWSSKASGAGDSLWFIAGELLMCLLIFGLSLWRGVGGITGLDLCCVGVAVLGVIGWQMVNLPMLALIAVIIADGAGALPTVLKALRNPRSEQATGYFASTISGGLGFLAVGDWNWMLLAYPGYIFLVNLVTALMVTIGRYHVREV